MKKSKLDTIKTMLNIGKAVYGYTQKTKRTKGAHAPSPNGLEKKPQPQNLVVPAKTLEDLLPLAHELSNRKIPQEMLLRLLDAEGRQQQPEYPFGTPEIRIYSDGKFTHSPMPEFEYESIIKHLKQNPDTPLVAAIGVHNIVEQQRIMQQLKILEGHIETVRVAISDSERDIATDDKQYILLVRNGDLPPPDQRKKAKPETSWWQREKTAWNRKRLILFGFLAFVAIIESAQLLPAYMSLNGLDPTNVRREIRHNAPMLVNCLLFILVAGIGFFWLGKEVVTRTSALVIALQQRRLETKYTAIGLFLWSVAYGAFCFSLSELRHSIAVGAQALQGQSPQGTLEHVFFILTTLLPLIMGMVAHRASQETNDHLSAIQREWEKEQDLKTKDGQDRKTRADQLLAALALKKKQLARHQARLAQLEKEKTRLELIAQNYEQSFRDTLRAQWRESQAFFRTHVYNLHLAQAAYEMAAHDNNQRRTELRKRHPNRDTSIARILELSHIDRNHSHSA